jgi:hypothetical protein
MTYTREHQRSLAQTTRALAERMADDESKRISLEIAAA